MTEIIIAIFLLCGGIVMTAKLHFFNPNVLLRAALHPFRKDKKQAGGVSPFAALCTALGGCVGTGNIIGVTACIMSGGAGCVFWIWVCAFFSMATKYAEVYFAACVADENGRSSPLHYITKFLKKGGKWLGLTWCILLILSSLFSGASVQANAISDAIVGVLPENAPLRSARIFCGIALAVITFVIIMGGFRRVSTISSALLPPACIAYVAVCALCVMRSGANVGLILKSIVFDAFSVKKAVLGGGAFAFLRSMRIGISCGIFSNEAGMGTSPLALCETDADARKKAGLGLWEIFIDTFVVCTSTAFLVLSCVGDLNAFSSPTAAVTQAVSVVLGERVGAIFLAVCMMLFAYTSIIGRSYYGTYGCELLFGKKKFALLYKVIFCIMVFGGCLFPLGVIWDLAATFNMVLAVPNVCALLMIGRLKK